MRDGDPPPDAGRPQGLPALEHAQQRIAGLFVEPEQPDELGENLILAAAAEREGDGARGEKVREVHGVAAS